MIGPIMGGRPKFKFDSNVNLVFVGNSLVEGFGLPDRDTQSTPARLQTMAPINNVITVQNMGVAARSIDGMRMMGYQVDGRYVAGKKNILIIWEGTNTIFNEGLTGLAAAAQMKSYCEDRLAVNPGWIIVQLTTIPRLDTAVGRTIDQGNQEMIAYDNYLKANKAAMKVRLVVDVRASGIFAYTGPTMSAAMVPYMAENIHTNVAGADLIAQYVAEGLKKLPLK